ncbi:hypothetical protein TSAR_009830 [Trichomalopsis sarcophagae]|uniref:Tyr recombinase domain-containing protein n=1 Tax=Trichomalopsis sarcophagae TaxID=543379 RepID=A0A232EK49_9HYME|nr:hypothetical protein TSAR_009830 [Trichomalopsis sarcophagae]
MKLQLFLKRKSAGYKPKKSAVFTKGNIAKFLNDAPDEIYLATKVVIIMGIAGALRRCEMTNLLTSDCLKGADLLLVSIKNTKN